MTDKAKPTMQQPVHHWSDGRLLFTATIEADETSPLGLRLGLAVRWAVLNRARLAGASLNRARLDGASLVGARLDGARLDGAIVRNAQGEDYIIEKIVARLQRSDGHTATAYHGKDGTLRIQGGCRFLSLEDFRAEAEAYGEGYRRAETLNILNFIEAEAIRQGVIAPAKKAAAKRAPKK